MSRKNGTYFLNNFYQNLSRGSKEEMKSFSTDSSLHPSCEMEWNHLSKYEQELSTGSTLYCTRSLIVESNHVLLKHNSLIKQGLMSCNTFIKVDFITDCQHIISMIVMLHPNISQKENNLH